MYKVSETVLPIYINGQCPIIKTCSDVTLNLSSKGSTYIHPSIISYQKIYRTQKLLWNVLICFAPKSRDYTRPLIQLNNVSLQKYILITFRSKYSEVAFFACGEAYFYEDSDIDHQRNMVGFDVCWLGIDGV